MTPEEYEQIKDLFYKARRMKESVSALSLVLESCAVPELNGSEAFLSETLKDLTSSFGHSARPEKTLELCEVVSQYIRDEIKHLEDEVAKL